MGTKTAVIITVLIMLVLVMSGILLKDYVTIGKPGSEEVIPEETTAIETTPPATTAAAAATTTSPPETTTSTTAATTATTTTTATTATTATTTATTAATTTATTAAITTFSIWTVHTVTGIIPLFKADLVITSGTPSVSPLTVAAGGSITLSGWTVKNQGNSDSGSFQNGFYLSTDSVITASDTYLDRNSNNNLAPGAQFTWGGPTLTIPHGTPPGTYYIGILVDRNNVVDESNESNNYVSRQITVN